MNHYCYGEPSVPPRRKRSLSTSRFDNSYDKSNFSFDNRGKLNYSTEHLPGESLYASTQRNPQNWYAQHQHNPQQPQSSQLKQYRHSLSSSHLYLPSQGQIPRFVNPYGVQSSQAKVPIRPHCDYLKYGQGVNVQYNPYSSGFNPTLMARPGLEPLNSTSISTPIANAIARGRSPGLYGSKEHLNQSQQNHIDFGKNVNFAAKTPPERPPPPKFNSRLSMENLQSPNMNNTKMVNFESDYNSRQDFRDRRSMSPSRVSPTDPRAYNIRRSTSPMPNLNSSLSPPLSRSPSGSQLYPSQNYSYRTSRETSPLMSRSPSPLRGLSYTRGTNHSFSDYEHQQFTRPASLTSKYISRSSILGGGSNRTYQSASNTSQLAHNTSSLQSGKSDLSNATSALSTSHILNNNGSTVYKDGYLNADKDKIFTSSDNNPGMDTLQLPLNGQDMLQQNWSNNHSTNQSHAKVVDPLFSENFTDHCDQYKSLTSKILSKKTNRKSGDFNDVDIKLDDETNHLMNKTPTNQFDACGGGEINRLSVEPEIGKTNSAEMQLEQNWNAKKPETLQHPTPEVSNTPRHSGTLDFIPQGIRKSSSSNGLTVHQRKGSLPTDYIAAKPAATNSLQLSDEWSRENVANMAHEARLRMKNAPSSTKTTFKKIGMWFTRQFIFLLIAGLNILIAYVFYNLLSMLPKDESLQK